MESMKTTIARLSSPEFFLLLFHEVAIIFNLSIYVFY